MGERKKVIVKINGQEYTVVSVETEEYIKEIARYVNDNIEEILDKNSKLSNTMSAVLAAFNIADRYYKKTSELLDLKENAQPIEEVENLKAELEKSKVKIETIKEEYETNILNLKKENENRIKTLREESENKLKTLREENEGKIKALVDENENKLKALRRESESKLNNIKEEKEKILKTLEVESKTNKDELLSMKKQVEQLTKKNKQFENAIQIKDDDLANNQKIINKLQDKILEHQLEIVRMKKELEESLKLIDK